MRKIAADAGVQPATLVRLAQHLGYDGWQSLRLVFVEALRGGPQPYAQRAQRLVRESGSDRMLETMLQAQHRNLEQTGAANAKALAQAAAILAGASTVHVAGFRSSYPIAFGFHYLYRLFRDSVHLVRGDAGTLEMDLRALKPTMRCSTSFAPYSQEIVRVAEAARRAGSKVIALSDSVAAPIALKADCTLVFSVDSPSFFRRSAPAWPGGSAGAATAGAGGQGAIKTLKQAEEQLHRSGACRPPAEAERKTAHALLFQAHGRSQAWSLAPRRTDQLHAQGHVRARHGHRRRDDGQARQRHRPRHMPGVRARRIDAPLLADQTFGADWRRGIRRGASQQQIHVLEQGLHTRAPDPPPGLRGTVPIVRQGKAGQHPLPDHRAIAGMTPGKSMPQMIARDLVGGNDAGRVARVHIRQVYHARGRERCRHAQHRVPGLRLGMLREAGP